MMWKVSEMYRTIVEGGRDPALVEADGRHRVQLHVFPLVDVAGLRRDPTLAGTFCVRLPVAIDGRLERATVEGLDNDPAAMACARAELASCAWTS